MYECMYTCICIDRCKYVGERERESPSVLIGGRFPALCAVSKALLRVTLKIHGLLAPKQESSHGH